MSEHRAARAAGLSPRDSARWLAYLAKCEAMGWTPIPLHEAVAQVRAARPEGVDQC